MTKSQVAEVFPDKVGTDQNSLAQGAIMSTNQALKALSNIQHALIALSDKASAIQDASKLIDQLDRELDPLTKSTQGIYIYYWFVEHERVLQSTEKRIKSAAKKLFAQSLSIQQKLIEKMHLILTDYCHLNSDRKRLWNNRLAKFEPRKQAKTSAQSDGYYSYLEKYKQLNARIRRDNEKEEDNNAGFEVAYGAALISAYCDNKKKSKKLNIFSILRE